ncbi:hypothetical protein N0V90_008468 [Kalmusia sp. IMI 367209]|nr:hypothetical protein N0V90_008468 [Kalmusia sp. IMI 367209]
MPGLVYNDLSSPWSSSASTHSTNPDHEPVINDDDYPAISFPGYAEKPLSQQLEPIAVVGMGSFNVLGGYFINSSLQEFDPSAFGITPIEAMWMDPQQRKLLEVVWETFESAGLSLQKLEGSKTAVFVGSFTSDYQQMTFKEPDFRHSYAATGVDPGLISNRIGHVFNLNGPSIVVNTACSSSVYAIHNACNALRNKECSGAVVGGTNLVLTVDQHSEFHSPRSLSLLLTIMNVVNTAKLGVLSPTSTCQTFNEEANGYGRADGVGAVLLKRLSDAIRDGDPIRGVIRSSAVNSNGKVPGLGITHPGFDGQEAVIRHAYQRGGDLDPRLTGFFECHGTGTAIGDPLEVHAVSMAMNEHRTPNEPPLLIGAVKPNIGHSEAASGLSALIKAVLTVEKGVIPPTRAVINKNPKILWDQWQVDVTTKPTPFPAHLPVKRVSVNSFGYGGTNAHMIIESSESFTSSQSYLTAETGKTKPPRSNVQRRRPHLLVLSAHDKVTMSRNIDALGKVVSNYKLLDLSYTLANRRSHLASRGFVVASYASLETAFAEDHSAFTFAERKQSPTIGFVFTGQGAQWPRMGAELMQYHPSFLKTIRHLDRMLEDLPDAPEWTLEDVLLASEDQSPVNEAAFAQPLCTAIQIALVDLLATWGVTPKVSVGHSSGEIGAAYASGLLTAAEAIAVAYYRGKAVASVQTDGAMLAVGLGAEDVQPYIEQLQNRVSIACHNSPASVTLSGDAEALQEVKSSLDSRSIFARLVKTNGKAYHSNHMAPVAAIYADYLSTAKSFIGHEATVQTPSCMVSSVTNAIIPVDTVLDETYWSLNLLNPVLFNQAYQTIATSPQIADVNMFIEIGPHSALAGPIKQIRAAFGYKHDYASTLVRGTDSAARLLALAGELFLRDYKHLDLDRVASIEHRLPGGKSEIQRGQFLVDLPTYQWVYRKTLWAEPRAAKEHRQPTHARHDILGSRIPGAGKTLWRNVLRIRDVPWLKHHSLGGEAVFPAAGYFSMAIEALTQLNELSESPKHSEGYLLRDVSIKKALITPDTDEGIEVLFTMAPSIKNETDSTTEWWDFTASSISQDKEQMDHVSGSITLVSHTERPSPRPLPFLSHRASGKAWNQALRDVGFDYGPSFQDMDNIQSDGANYHASADTCVKAESGIMQGESRYVIHPGVLDSCLQLIIVSIYAGRINNMTCGAVPIQVDEVAIWQPTLHQLEETAAKAFSWTHQRGLRSFVSGTELVSKDGSLLMRISDMRCTAYEAAVPQKPTTDVASQPYQQLVWKPDVDHLRLANVTEKYNILSFTQLCLFKRPSIRILEIGSKHLVNILGQVPNADYCVLQKGISIDVSSYPSVQHIDQDIHNLDDDHSVSEKSFDLVIAPAELLKNETSVTRIQTMIASGGQILWDSESSYEISTIDATSEQAFGTMHEARLYYRNQAPESIGLVQNALQTIGWSTSVVPLDDAVLNPPIHQHVIMLEGLEGSLLSSITEQEFVAVQSIVDNAAFILWVTPGGVLNGNKPEFAMIAGLARSVRSEQAMLKFVTLDFDADTCSMERVAEVIAGVIHEGSDQVQGRLESEYSMSHDQVYISRLTPNADLNKAYSPQNEAVPTPFTSDLNFVGKIQKGSVAFESDLRVNEPLSANEVEVQVLVGGLTRDGALVITGTDYPTTFSHEIGGIITRVGYQVRDLAVGDSVAGFNFDKFASHQRASPELVQKVSRESLGDFVSLLMPFATALHGLTLASIQVFDTVLILEGAGTAGAAAIQVTQLLGGIPYVAVESDAEAKLVTSQLNVPIERIIVTPNGSKLALFEQLTGFKAPDVVFSSGSTSSALAREAWRFLAPFGRFVDVGRKEVLKREMTDNVPFRRGANYLSFDILGLYKHKPKVLSRILQSLVSLFDKGSIWPVGPISAFPVANIQQAVASLKDTFTSGRTLIEYKSSETPLALLPSRPTVSFRSDASYLLVGCLGGLGRSLTTWMMEHGARRFVFLSRSGTDAEAAALLVQSLEEAGMNVLVVRGDASVKEDVERTIASVPPEFPVRGVVHAAMVLRDGLFAQMTYADWQTSTRPKVMGAQNLHECLVGQPLDFFVMTSSVSGVLGTPAQSNYAAANAYLDSLASYRRARGLPATSIILPMVLGVGVVAENFGIEESLKRKGMYGIEEEELLNGFGAALHTEADHVVVGLDPQRLSKAKPEDTDSFWQADPRFDVLESTMAAGSTSRTSGVDDSIIEAIKNSASPDAARKLVITHFFGKLVRLLLLDTDEPDEGRSIASYGLDSMIGAELRTWIFREYGIDVSIQQLLAPTFTVPKIADLVLSGMGSGAK